MAGDAGKGSGGHRARLRERFGRSGFAGFADHEVLELLLTLCIPRCDVKGPAKELLARFGSLRAVMDAQADELRAVPGIGAVAPVALRIIREAATLYAQQGLEETPVLASAFRLREFLLLRFGDLRVECVDVLHLDSGQRLLPRGIERHETGTVHQVLFTPRKLAESALRRGAKSLVLAHNHPGGSPAFSREDVQLTHAARAALAAVEVDLLDHILVCDGEALSFRKEGLFDSPAGGRVVEWRQVAEDRGRYG